MGGKATRGTCVECLRDDRRIVGRGLCRGCYDRRWQAGTLDEVPLQRKPAAEPLSVVRTEKYCPRCKTTQPIDEFPLARSRVDGRAGHCKPCHRAKYDPVTYRADQLQRRYGITVEEFDALFVTQGGRCAVCPVSVGPGGSALAVDHCHTTGKVRGILCHNCNNGLGRFGDDPERLRIAASYLERALT